MNEFISLRTASYLVVFLALTAYVLLRAGRHRPQNRLLKLMAVGMLFLLFVTAVVYWGVLCSVVP